jgi:hypothetical protein
MQGSGPQPPKIQRVIAILWPSFVVASFATIAFFSWFDPLDLLASGDHFNLSRMGVYTIGFFSFWLVTAASSVLTAYFERPTQK